MALSTRARNGIQYAASIAGVEVEVFKESVLEAKGLEWAQAEEASIVACRSRKLPKASKAILDAIDALPET